MHGILAAALEAADPAAAVRRALKLRDGRVLAGGEQLDAQRVWVVAVGKAAGPMARAAAEVLGEAVCGGVVVTRDGYEEGPPELEMLFASHPRPDERGEEAAWRVKEIAEGLDQGDLLLALISGGASALLADPAEGITLRELGELTGELLASGASISEINAVRRALSTLKGGGLARAALPAPTLALLLSDVVGDDPLDIGSGPAAPDPATPRHVAAIARRYGLRLPPGARGHLEKAREAPPAHGAVNVVVGGGRLSCEAAVEQARRLGYSPLLLSTTMTGEARALAGAHAAIIRETLQSGNPLPPPCALVSGGEATVVVRGAGRGGPNQEFALALAVELEGVEGWSALAADTDGADGPTDAAGGLVDGRTAERCRRSGHGARAALEDNDAWGALEAAGALVRTGPTATNVNDLRVALIGGVS